MKRLISKRSKMSVTRVAEIVSDFGDVIEPSLIQSPGVLLSKDEALGFPTTELPHTCPPS